MACHLDVETLTEKGFHSLPLVIRGESKEVRYAGHGLVVIRLLPTIHSFTYNRSDIVPGSELLRLRACRVFQNVLHAANIDHAYLKVTDSWILARLVLPHDEEFHKYGMEPFVPHDLSSEEVALLPRGPPIEVILKNFHGGTSKMRYRGMDRTRVRNSHPHFAGLALGMEAPYPVPLVRFDWRNPQTLEHETHEEPDARSVQTASAMLKHLQQLETQHREGPIYQRARDLLLTYSSPKSMNVQDEILPEPLADLFIDANIAKQTALNTYYALQSFLDHVDVVCNDLCLFITEDGKTVFGEISQDCGRFRHFNLGSLDKDVWRAGSSPSHVLEKWTALLHLIEDKRAFTSPTSLLPPFSILMKPMELRLGTTNPWKIAEVASMLQHLQVQLVILPPQEVEEPHHSFAENAKAKAVAYSSDSTSLTLCEDSGLSVAALHGLPGVHSARFADFTECDPKHGPKRSRGYIRSGRSRGEMDNANNKRILELMAGEIDRRATMHVSICVASQGQVLYEASFHSSGSIALEPRGSNGFGYDPIFIGDDTHGLSYAELDGHRKNLRSHRRRVLRRLAGWLAGRCMQAAL